MPLFERTGDNQLEKLKENTFKNEREIQTLTEQSLNEIFRLEFVKTEFSLNNLRIDTLAYDQETKSFIVIEYKSKRNFSVIDQGYAYLALLLNNKADFILEYNENKDKNIKRDDVDWSQSKVIFISPQFTKYQKQAINFEDLPIELWEIKQYENNTVLYNQLKSPDTSESITVISPKSEAAKKVTREIKIYTEQDHLKLASPKIEELWQELKENVLNLGNDIEIKFTKFYIAFKANTNFIDVRLQKSQIKIWLNLTYGTLNDPTQIARDMSNVGHWGNGEYEIIMKTNAHMRDVMDLVSQSYRIHSS